MPSPKWRVGILVIQKELRFCSQRGFWIFIDACVIIMLVVWSVKWAPDDYAIKRHHMHILNFENFKKNKGEA